MNLVQSVEFLVELDSGLVIKCFRGGSDLGNLGSVEVYMVVADVVSHHHVVVDDDPMGLCVESKESIAIIVSLHLR